MPSLLKKNFSCFFSQKVMNERYLQKKTSKKEITLERNPQKSEGLSQRDS